MKQTSKEFQQWSKQVKQEIKRLQSVGDLAGAAWLANAHAKQLISINK